MKDAHAVRTSNTEKYMVTTTYRPTLSDMYVDMKSFGCAGQCGKVVSTVEKLPKLVGYPDM